MADISCAAATLGCRVKDSSGTVYALSCNHVYALENKGQNGVTPASQPSSLDDGCKIVPANDIGTLYNFAKINFSGESNVVDCAIVIPWDCCLPGGGGMTYCNPIASVLKALDVTIDGE